MKTEKAKMKSAVDRLGKGFEIFLLVVLVVYCLSLMLPLIWMLLASVKSFDDYLLNSFGIPKTWNFSNYKEVFEVFKVPYKGKNGGRVTYGFVPMAYYSVIWTFGTAFVHVALNAMCAYALAAFNFKGKNLIYNIGIFVMVIPIVGSTPSAMILRESMGIRNNMFLLMFTSENCAFSGFFKVVLPMILPSMVAVFVLKFLASWTDYSTFLIWLPSYPSLSVGMFLFEQSATKTGVSMPVVLATFVVVTIPTVILYFATQNILMSKFTVGGLKG